MRPNSAYQVRIKTGSDDSNAFLLLEDGELVAILVELADESHGDDRGRWVIEATFGLNSIRRPQTFAGAGEAANWISQHSCQRPFALTKDVILLA